MLGTLLFSLFINDIGNDLLYSKHMIFADDLQIYLSCLPSELHAGLLKISYDVGVIARYADCNGLKLNLQKTKIIIQGSGAYVSQLDLNSLMPIGVGDIIVPYVSEVRNLGIVMSSNLSWHKQVIAILQKGHICSL